MNERSSDMRRSTGAVKSTEFSHFHVCFVIFYEILKSIMKWLTVPNVTDAVSAPAGPVPGGPGGGALPQECLPLPWSGGPT